MPTSSRHPGGRELTHGADDGQDDDDDEQVEQPPEVLPPCDCESSRREST
ncbi:hypothetical protein N9L68_04270 [bacterium]|nr:hypothetical protein [bacterium]